jgi:uncharacterized protein involved in exopolysaccharide biosynthesis
MLRIEASKQESGVADSSKESTAMAVGQDKDSYAGALRLLQSGSLLLRVRGNRENCYFGDTSQNAHRRG